MCGLERLLTLPEAAEYLRIHWKTLQGIASRGEIPAFKVGHVWRFRESDLRTWVDAKVRSSLKTSRRN